MRKAPTASFRRRTVEAQRRSGTQQVRGGPGNGPRRPRTQAFPTGSFLPPHPPTSEPILLRNTLHLQLGSYHPAQQIAGDMGRTSKGATSVEYRESSSVPLPRSRRWVLGPVLLFLRGCRAHLGTPVIVHKGQLCAGQMPTQRRCLVSP